MKVYVFGNLDLKEDSLPLRILPDLKRELPSVDFEEKDPNEDWDIPKEFVVIDTVVGIDKVVTFSSLEDFSRSGRLTVHDFDAFSNMILLQKLGKLKKIKIIGLPPNYSEKKAVRKIKSLLEK